MKYLRKFDSVSDMETAIASSEISIMGLAYNGSTPVMEIKTIQPTPPVTKATPFYIDVRGGRITFSPPSGLQMSTDGENWTDAREMSLPTGKTYLRVASNQSTPLKINLAENSDSDYDIGGNINSLVKVNFENDTNCYNFYVSSRGFFYNKSKLKSAGNLILPATTLTDGCYREMFSGCTSLTTAPELPATTLASNCYNSMFNGCASLITAPELPATTLIGYCYGYMFRNCTNLNYIKCLAANIPVSSCTNTWLQGVAASGTFVKDSSMSSWTTGANGIPEGWTVEDA